MNSYTPRHLRRKGNTSRNGSVDSTKSAAFRKAALVSKKFINQPASALASAKLNHQYKEWCRRADAGTLRAS